MCSKNDSDATYCSEVEELLKASNLKKNNKITNLLKHDIAATVTLKKISTNVPLRRSQRLYQKLNVKTMISGNLADSTRSQKVTHVEDMKVSVHNKFTQDIFSIQDIREVEEIGHSNNISYNEIPSCFTEHIPDISGVPLDLSKKSKELIVETLRTNAPMELEAFIVENVLGVSKSGNHEGKKLCKTRKLNTLQCTQAVSDLNKISVIKNLDKNSENRSIKPPDSVQNISNTKETSCDKKYPHKRRYKKSFQSLKEKSPLISGKRRKVSEDETLKNLKENENFAKISKQKLKCRNNPEGQKKCLSNDCTKSNLNISTKCKKKSKKVTNKTSVSVKNINHSWCNSCDRTDSYKKTSKIGMPLKEHLQNLLNEHLEFNKLKNEVKPSKYNAYNNNNILKRRSFVFNENIAKAGALTDEFNNTNLKLETKIEDIRKIQPIQRSCESFSKTKTKSSEFQDLYKIVKSEPFSSMNMYEQTAEERKIEVQSSINFAENISIPGAVPNRLQNNSTLDKNQIIKCRKSFSPKSSDELKSSMILRSATTANVSQKLPDKKNTSSKNKSNKWENICSQESERKKRKTSQHIYTAKQMKPLSPQRIDEDVLNKNELKKLTLNTTRSRASFSKERTVRGKTPKALNSIANIKHKKENIQTKAEVKSENSILSKNYLESFDRTKFLDKIQNSRNNLENLYSQNNSSKLNTYESLLTPADSSEDFLKRSILPDAYPPHFKHQLPPEAVLTRSLDCQPFTTSVITPDDTISAELLESSSSSPSLPESLCKLFKAKDIKKILNVERKSYRLYNYHVQALALILKLRLEFLTKILDKLINTSPNVLKNINKAVNMPLIPDNDVFAASPDNL